MVVPFPICIMLPGDCVVGKLKHWFRSSFSLLHYYLLHLNNDKPIIGMDPILYKTEAVGIN